jgi:hypothetical protein
MDLGTSLRIWRRWWILSLVLFLLTVTGASATLLRSRSYQASSTVILLASRSAAKLNGGNPYLSFNPSLTLAADAVSREVAAPQTAAALAGRGFRDAYTVALAPYTTNTTGSVLVVTVTGNSKVAVERMMHAVTGEVSVELAQLQVQSQKGVPTHNRIRTATLSYTPQAALNVSQTARPVVTLTVVGLLLSFGIPVAADGLLARRRPARRHRGVLPREEPDSAHPLAAG